MESQLVELDALADDEALGDRAATRHDQRAQPRARRPTVTPGSRIEPSTRRYELTRTSLNKRHRRTVPPETMQPAETTESNAEP